VTDTCLRARRTREPFELACRPSPASSTPALINSSLYLPMAARSFWSGSTPASARSSLLTIIMNRIVVAPFYFRDERRSTGSTGPRVFWDNAPRRGSLRLGIRLPEREGVALRVDEHREPAHGRHG